MRFAFKKPSLPDFAWISRVKIILGPVYTKWTQRYPWLRWAMVFVVVSIVVGSLLFLLLRPDPIPPPMPVHEEKILLLRAQDVVVVLRRMAKERDLRSLSLEAHPFEVVIRASLDPSANAILKRMLNQFFSKYETAVPVITAVSLASDRLPFTVAQVITGTMASIVTTEGERAFVGDRLHGYQLIQIEPGKLTFLGEQRIELAW